MFGPSEPIQFEFAHFAARIGPGSRNITILEVGEQPLASFDRDMVDLLLKASTMDGIHVRSNTQIAAIERQGDMFFVRTDSGTIYEADLVVHGAGRNPDIEKLDIESIGVDVSKKKGFWLMPTCRHRCPTFLLSAIVSIHRHLPV